MRDDQLKKGFLSVFILAVLLSTAVTSQATRRERHIDTWKPIHYDVRISLDNQLRTISQAETRIILTVLKAGVRDIDLDFGELTIDSVTVENKSVSYTHQSGILDVKLSKALTAGRRIVVAVNYHGSPKDGLVMTNDKDGHPAAVGDNWPDRVHHWIPSLDHPSAKATVTFNITAPANDLVVANGKLLQLKTTSSAMRTWTYEESAPIPPYCMVFAAGQFAKVDSQAIVTPLSYYVPPSDESTARRDFVPASASLKFFADTIAPYPYEKLALIVGATQFGGMENSSAIVFPATVFNTKEVVHLSSTFKIPKSVVEVVAHEIAHQWFGDSVTETTWSDLWLSEGFATYFAGLFVEQTDGEEAFRSYMKKGADTYFKYELEHRTPIYDAETDDLFKLLNPNNYQKGAWVLHMLRSQLGDKAFFNGLRAYYLAHKSGTANSEDLRKALGASSGQDLRQFFASWIYGAGHPTYEWAWKWNSEQKSLRVDVRQLQLEGSFPNWLPLEITTASGKHQLLFKPTMKSQSVSFAMAEAPISIRFDPDDTILKEVVSVKP